VGRLPADERAGSQQENDLVYEDGGQRMERVKNDTPADDGGNRTKHQNSQLAGDIHEAIPFIVLVLTN
jgi:hypothetical protein